MALAVPVRAVGRAGLFTLSVLRASVPSADLFRELVREIYKIGARSLPIIVVGGAFVGLEDMVRRRLGCCSSAVPARRSRPNWG